MSVDGFGKRQDTLLGSQRTLSLAHVSTCQPFCKLLLAAVVLDTTELFEAVMHGPGKRDVRQDLG